MTELPAEVLGRVLRFLTVGDLLRCELVCALWRQLLCHRGHSPVLEFLVPAPLVVHQRPQLVRQDPLLAAMSAHRPNTFLL